MMTLSLPTSIVGLPETCAGKGVRNPFRDTATKKMKMLYALGPASAVLLACCFFFACSSAAASSSAFA